MRPLTIALEEQQFAALEAIARENGSEGAESFVRHQLARFLAAYQGAGVSPEVRRHLRTSIQENRGLLERLAQ
jgi:hypothetical protein